ncbi:MAG: class I SAM-dependent methyltransferase [Candidatus Omnitrophica bacterium]|nr:class I SAM-dependent methyltransferase [Candidatus Omnitrophota bacterium]
MGSCETIRLLKRYLQMYWLKPFDAVNDTANAAALLKFDWTRGPLLEIGGGDGVFSFIMHAGAFRFLDDRYDQADVAKKGDIYDIYKEGRSLGICKNATLRYDLGIDLKLSHLLKARKTGICKYLTSSLPEALPAKDNHFGTIFLYTFHGLTDYERTLQEIRRVIKSDGRLLMLVVNSGVRENFVCYKLHRFFNKVGFKALSDYFLALDGGRHDEIGGIFSKSAREWEALLKKGGFRIEEAYSQVSPLLWRIYDTQTRPFLKLMIRMNRLLKYLRLKFIAKVLWVYLWLPVISIFYFAMARPKKVMLDSRCRDIFLAVTATPL